MVPSKPTGTAWLTCGVVLTAFAAAQCGGTEPGDRTPDRDAGPNGSLFEATAVLPDGGFLGRVRSDGTVVDNAGHVIGTVESDGDVVDPDGKVIGTAAGLGFGSIDIGDCAAEIVAGENVPLDIFIMFDQSGSMVQKDARGTARIDAVRSAISDFLTAPASRGLGSGIGYFGKQPIGEVSCDPGDYSDPDVGIGRLPENATPITASLASVEPTGETPTGAAIRGACEYARGWQAANPSHVTIVLLVTDGVPEAPVSSTMGGCKPTLADAVAAASRCKDGASGVATYVIGVGPSLDNLDEIARAGGSGDAYLVEGGDVAAEMLRALNEVRGTATVPCEFTIPAAPEGESLDFGRVNAVYTTPDGNTEQLPYVESSGGCDPHTGGWYYDDASAPTRLLLCESTCADVEEPGGRFSVALGCQTVTSIR